MAVAVVASSCQKDLGGSPDSPVVPGAVPADFDWKTTRNVTVSVSAPVVEGTTPPYAVIRIYSSPILSAENLAARGVAVVMNSSDMLEVIGMSSRVIVMYEGRISGVLEKEELTEERIMQLGMGLGKNRKEGEEG